MNASDNAQTNPGAARGTDSADATRPRKPRTAGTAGGGEREALAAVMDALADAVDAAHDHLRSASPATRALIDEHESWPENFIWTDGSQVAEAARRIAALLRRHPDPPAAAEPSRRQRRARRGT